MKATTLRNLVTVSLILFFGFVNCSKETDPNKAKYWLDRLDDPQNRDEAFHKLGKLKAKEAIPELLTRFKEDLYQRAPIAASFGEIGDPSVIPDMIAAIDYKVGSGSDKRSRNINRANEKIIEALGNFKAKEAIEPIIKMLRTPNPYVKKACCRALGKIGDPKSIDALSKIVNEDSNMNIRRTAVEALGDIGDEKAIPTLLKAMFIERGSSLYPYASFALFQIGKPAVAPLKDVLSGKNEEINKMEEQLNFVPGAVHAKTVEILGDLRPTDIEDDLIRLYNKYDKMSLEKSPVKELVKRNIVIALEKVGGANSAKLFASDLQKTKDFSVREFYSMGLNHLNARNLLPQLLNTAKDGDVDARRVVIRAYTQLGTGKELAALEKFEKTMKAKDTATLDTMKKVIEREKIRLIAAKECSEDVACWVKKISDKSGRVREKAAYELARLKAVQNVDLLVKATSDAEEGVRRAAIWALFKLRTPKGIEIMEQTLEDEKGKPDYIRINEELKRLIVYLKNIKRSKA